MEEPGGAWKNAGAASGGGGQPCHAGASHDLPHVHGQVLWKTLERGCSQGFTSSELSPRSASRPPTPLISSNLAKLHLTVFPPRFSLPSHLCEWVTFRGSFWLASICHHPRNSSSMMPLPLPPHTHCQSPRILAMTEITLSIGH